MPKTITTSTNIKAKKISELDTLDELYIKEWAEQLYLPAAYVVNSEANTNYKIPLKVILAMINNIGCKCQDNLENKFLALLQSKIDFSWHTIDRLPKEISLGFRDGKIVLNLRGGVTPEPEKKFYTVSLTINGPINNDLSISAWDIKEDKVLLDVPLLKNDMVFENIYEGADLKLNLYEYVAWLQKNYSDINKGQQLVIKDTINSKEHDVVLDNENYRSWTDSVEIYDDTHINVDVYRHVSITCNDSEGIQSLLFNDKLSHITTIDNELVKYGDTAEVVCNIRDNYYIKSKSSAVLDFNNNSYNFEIYKKPYVNFHVLAFNGDNYTGTSICNIVAPSLEDTVKTLEKYYDVNTTLDSIVTNDIKGTLQYGGYYSLHSPLYYKHTPEHKNPESINLITENTEVDVVLKQNTAKVNIIVTDTENIESNYELPLIKTLNYEILHSKDTWTNPDITCDLKDPDSYKFDIKYKKSDGKSAKTILDKIISVTQNNNRTLIKFKDVQTVNFGEVCQTNEEYTIEIGTTMIEKFVYYAGWELPSTLQQLYSLATGLNGENITDKKSSAKGTIIRSLNGELTHKIASWYIIIPEWVGIYGPDAVNTTEDTFDEPDTTSLPGYKIFSKNGSFIKGYTLKIK